MIKKIIILVALFLLMAPSLKAQDNNLRPQFRIIRQNTVWPVKGSSNADIVSAFGPRSMTANNTYDWHRGLDVAGDLNAKVKAVDNGELFYQTTWEGAGNTVILRHTFNSPTFFQGKELTYWYSVYMHLNSFKYADADLGKTINAGQVIGFVGQTGNATSPHLHLEVRVGTWYELEVQLAYPDSQYSGFGFDPAVNPMILFAPQAKNISLTLAQAPTRKRDGKINAVFSAGQPIFNKVKLIIKDKATNTKVLEHILNYNTRVGFDAATNEALDTPDITKPYIYPDSIYPTNIIIPKKYLKDYLGENYTRTLYVYDIWGRKQQLKDW